MDKAIARTISQHVDTIQSNCNEDLRNTDFSLPTLEGNSADITFEIFIATLPVRRTMDRAVNLYLSFERFIR